MRRREVIAGIAAGAWPLCTNAQQADKVRRVGVVLQLAQGDPGAEERQRVLEEALAELGWRTGQNIDVIYRFSTSNAERIRHAAELVALAPDVIMAFGSGIGPMLQATRTIP